RIAEGVERPCGQRLLANPVECDREQGRRLSPQNRGIVDGKQREGEALLPGHFGGGGSGDGELGQARGESRVPALVRIRAVQRVADAAANACAAPEEGVGG